MTVAGRLATDGEAVTAIEAPPLGAGEVSATVQVLPVEGEIEVGLQERLLNPGV